MQNQIRLSPVKNREPRLSPEPKQNSKKPEQGPRKKLNLTLWKQNNANYQGN